MAGLDPGDAAASADHTAGIRGLQNLSGLLRIGDLLRDGQGCPGGFASPTTLRRPPHRRRPRHPMGRGSLPGGPLGSRRRAQGGDPRDDDAWSSEKSSGASGVGTTRVLACCSLAKPAWAQPLCSRSVHCRSRSALPRSLSRLATPPRPRPSCAPPRPPPPRAFLSHLSSIIAAIASQSRSTSFICSEKALAILRPNFTTPMGILTLTAGSPASSGR